MKPSEILRAARAKIATPDRWDAFQGGCPLPLWDGSWETTWQTAGHFADAIGDTEIYDWLDAPGRTHAEVLAAFDRAIELAEGEGQ
jgi:hypothetical protein